jgi:hypothetical protein
VNIDTIPSLLATLIYYLFHRMNLQGYVREIGKKPTRSQQVELAMKRGRLANRIAEHQRRATRLLHISSDQPEDYSYSATTEFFDGEDGEIHLRPLLNDDGILSEPSDSRPPEKFKITLPSTMSHPKHAISTANDGAVNTEKELRIGECNDALEGIRLALGKKAFLFKTQIREKGPKTGKTRPWDALHATDDTLRHHAQLYRASRAALVTLGASPEVLSKYQVLDPKHLKTSTTLLDTSIHGQKHESLPWFWYLDIGADVQAGDQMKECTSTFHEITSALIIRLFSSSGQLAPSKSKS